jgi:hypothetical protein
LSSASCTEHLTLNTLVVPDRLIKGINDVSISRIAILTLWKTSGISW